MASFILTVEVPQAQRIAAAVGLHLHLIDGAGKPRSATAEEVKAFLVDYLTGIVQWQEKQSAIATLPSPSSLVVI